MTDPDDLLDDSDINVSFDLDHEDLHTNNSRNFNYPKKTERYSSFRLDDDDDAEEEPQYEHRAPSPSPLHEISHVEEDVPDIPQTFSNPEPAPIRTREDSDDEDNKRERSRFTSERKINLSGKGSSNNNSIPDTLDKVTVRTTSTSGSNKWKGKPRQNNSRQPARAYGRSSFGNDAQPLFSQNNTILQSMMRGWDQNGYGPYQSPISQMGNRNMVVNAHNDWFTPYNSDPYQSNPYQSWSSGHGYQTHYSQPVQQYPQMNMSSPSYGFNRNVRGMPYVHPVYQSSPPTNVRTRLGPAKRESSSIGGPPAKAAKTTPPEKHRNLRPVDTVNKQNDKKEDKEEKKEEEPGVPGETEPPPPPPKEVDIKELFPETNDAEMSEYMKKIEEQKRKREALVKEKEMKRMREAQIKLEQQMAVHQTQQTEGEKSESNGLDTKATETKEEAPVKTEVPAKLEAPTNAEKPIKSDVPAKTDVVPAKPESQPKVEVPAAKVENKQEEKKTSGDDVPGTKLVRVKTREGKIVVRRVPLETLSKMKKLSPEQASEAKEMVDPKKSVVLVENLSATTTKEQLFNMGKQVGVVLEAEVDGETKSGRIAFENAQLANAFMTKFQRKMVDLSMITLVLATADELWPPLPTQLDDE